MSKILDLEYARGIQRTILDQISDTVPSRLVDPLWQTYSQEIGVIKSPPCTCTPKYWKQVVDSLRDLVTRSIEYHTANPVVEEIKVPKTKKKSTEAED
jgi:hypothetical protein